MLKRLQKIKNLGVFSDFSASAEMPDFERFNLIYGSNGSGKTTLSRLFLALNNGTSSSYPELQYKITTANGELSETQAHQTKIRVFNSDYVDLNIGQIEGHLNHILIIGEENKAVSAELASEQVELTERSAKLAENYRSIEKLQDQKGKVFSQTAKTIGASISGSVVRNYRKNNAEADYAKLAQAELLNEDDFKNAAATVHQERLDLISTSYTDTLSKLCDEIVFETNRANELALKSAQIEAIKRLSDNAEIAQWVEAGLKIHKNHDSKNCEFCEQPLKQEYLHKLATHFSDADQALKLEIDIAIQSTQNLGERLKQIQTLPTSLLYSELRAPAEAHNSRINDEIAKIDTRLKTVTSALTKKLTQRSESYSANLKISVSTLKADIDLLAGLIGRHNKKTSDFDVEVEQARNKLIRHHLSDVYAEVDQFEKQIIEHNTTIQQLLQGGHGKGSGKSLDDLRASIETKRAQISNAHKAAQILTAHLQTFLGRSELEFQSTSQGYAVTRQGKPAARLSEGERTAIAFIYFIVQLSDQDFSTKDGIIIIDDPVSSLDSNSIYQAFAFLKNAVKDAKQVFLLTHNFDFLKLLLNWLHTLPKRHGRKAYYMIHCTNDANSRKSDLLVLDKLLREHQSEYHYLFKILFEFKSDGKIATAYHIPNVARKVLETFFEFYDPRPENLYAKMDDANFDENKKTAIYKFANDLSHHTGKGFDPALVGETQKNVEYLIEMIKSLAPLHFDGLTKAVTPENVVQ